MAMVRWFDKSWEGVVQHGSWPPSHWLLLGVLRGVSTADSWGRDCYRLQWVSAVERLQQASYSGWRKEIYRNKFLGWAWQGLGEALGTR